MLAPRHGMRHRGDLTPPLAGFVAGILLTPDRNALLRACLFDGAAGQEAWRAWLRQVGDPKAFFGDGAAAARGLLPLLFDSARRSAVPLDASFQTYLRTAWLRERVRAAAYSRIGGEILAALVDAGIDVVALRGNAFAEELYPTPWLRHSHGLDLLLRSAASCGRAVERLAAGGLVVPPQAGQPSEGAVRLAHPSGLAVMLRSGLFDNADHAVPMDELWARCENRAVSRASVRVLAPADALLEVCGRAWISPSRANLNWVCDAWLLIRRHRDMDWGLLAWLARRARLALPVQVALAYLAGPLQAPVPPSALALLAEAARSDPATSGLYLIEARRSVPGGPIPLLRRIPGWRNRLAIAAQIAWPSNEYLRLAYGTAPQGGRLRLHLRRAMVFGWGTLLAPIRRRRRGAGATAVPSGPGG